MAIPNEPIDVDGTGDLSRRIQLVLVVVLGAILRLIWLESVPPGVNQDEAIHAYDAYCLLQTGMDHAGVRWPVFVHANGIFESHSAPFIYLLIPFQAILGMSVWSARLPAALLGALTIPLVYSLVRRWYGHRAAILASLFLAISPWHIHLCRLAFEVSICPFLFTLGLWLFVRAFKPAQSTIFEPRGSAFVLLGLAGLSLGIVSWTYNAMRVFVPLILLAGVAIYARKIIGVARRPRGRLAIVAFALGFLLGVAPFLWACVKTPDQAWGHARMNFILNQTASFSEAITSVARTYAMHVGPAFLFLKGDPSLTQHMAGHGQLYGFDALLLLLGLNRIFRRYRVEPIGLFLLAWLLAAPVPAAITKLEAGHALRSAAALPAYQILSALGLDMLLTVARRRSLRLSRIAVYAVGLLISVSAGYASYLLFWTYPALAAPFFAEDGPKIVAEIQHRQADYDLVLLAPGEMGGNHFLFLSRMPPREFFDAPKNILARFDWDIILQVGKYIFVGSQELGAIVAQLPPEVVRPRVLVVEVPGIQVPGVPILRIDNRKGRPVAIFYDVRVDRAH